MCNLLYYTGKVPGWFRHEMSDLCDISRNNRSRSFSPRSEPGASNSAPGGQAESQNFVKACLSNHREANDYKLLDIYNRWSKQVLGNYTTLGDVCVSKVTGLTLGEYYEFHKQYWFQYHNQQTCFE